MAVARIDGADLWPQIQAEGSAGRSKQNFLGFPFASGDVPVVYNTNYRAGIGFSWEIDLWGRIRSAKSAALADVQASQADLAGAQLSIAAQTTKAWLAVTEAQLQLDLAHRTLTAFQETEDIAWGRYSRGLLTSLDVRLTRNSTATAAALVARREDQLQRAKRLLEILLGRYPRGELIAAGDLPAELTPVPAGLPADLVSRRPDLAAAERRLAAAGKRIAVAKRARYPRISLTGSAGTSTQEFNDLLDGDFSVWSIVGNLVQPIFQGGRLQAQVRLAEAQEDATLAQYANAVLFAYAEVENALVSERLLAREEISLREAAIEARAAWDLSSDRYATGVGDLLTVLESQRRSLNNDAELLAVRRRRLEARVNLFLALGGGFEWRDVAPAAETAAEDDSPPPPQDVGAVLDEGAPQLAGRIQSTRVHEESR
jgi:NodT family efflux transporter outer membrane factor (OMF) lipoprotein